MKGKSRGCAERVNGTGESLVLAEVVAGVVAQLTSSVSLWGVLDNAGDISVGLNPEDLHRNAGLGIG